MSMNLEGIKSIEDFDLKDKVVFLRVDFNVPMKGGEIADDTRIRAALPTLRYAMDKGAKLVLGSHLGRPETLEDRKKYSLEPIAERLGELVGLEVLLVEDPLSDTPKLLINSLKRDKLILLENLRFVPGETQNDEKIPYAVKKYAHIFINDAFGASHRAHSSIVGLAKEMKNHGIGLLMKKEIEMLDRVLHGSEKPYVAILGGAKVSDKIPIIDKLIDKVDAFIIGGGMAYTFLKAQSLGVGRSLLDPQHVSFAKGLIQRMEARGKKIYLPIDHVVADDWSSPSKVRTTEGAAIDEGFMGLDIGPKTIELYKKALIGVKTVFWNGPMGVFEKKEYSRGTFELAQTLAQSEAMTFVGGGDSASAARAAGCAEKMSHISTGGGASLEYLQGVQLPGLLALRGKFFE